MSQQVSVATAPVAVAPGAWQQPGPPALTKENAMPAERRMAAPSASALFFMMKFQFKLLKMNACVAFQSPAPFYGHGGSFALTASGKQCAFG